MRSVGSIKSKPLKDLADAAALSLCEIHDPERYVLTLSPEGRVRIEREEDAVETDIVGKYLPKDHRVPRWVGLAKCIVADLEHEVGARRKIEEGA